MVSEIYHYGIKGQKWGVRNYQNEDGSYTTKGQAENGGTGRYNPSGSNNSEANSRKGLSEKTKKYLKIGAAIAGTALLAYGGYKLYQNKDLLSMKAKMGKENVKFIQESETFDYLKTETNEKQLSQDLLNAYESIKNDDFAPGVFDAEQVKNLTDDEIKAIRAYTTPLYKEANAVLRGDGEGTIAGKMIASGVKEALSKVTLSDTISVQRGVNQTVGRKILGIDGLTEVMRIRSEFGNNTKKMKLDSIKNISDLDHGIMSTAIPFITPRGKAISVADEFSGKDGIILELVGDKGLHGMYISPISEMKSEREVIFAPDSRVELTGEIQIIDGIAHVFGRIIQNS